MVAKLFTFCTLPLIYLTPIATFFMWSGVETSVPDNLTKLILATIVVAAIWLSVFFSRKWVRQNMQSLPVGIDRLLTVVAAVFVVLLLFGISASILDDINRGHSNRDTGDMIFLLLFGGPCIVYLFCLALSVVMWVVQGFK